MTVLQSAKLGTAGGRRLGNAAITLYGPSPVLPASANSTFPVLIVSANSRIVARTGAHETFTTRCRHPQATILAPTIYRDVLY
jgi:hypothetical protein